MTISLDFAPDRHAAPILLALCLGLSACDVVASPRGNSSSPTEEGTPISLKTDHFGCPVFEPVPYVESPIVYAEFCGDGCRPQGATRVDDGSSWFVACISDQIVRPVAASDVSSCVTGPIDGADYWASDTETNSVLIASCWIPCDAESPNDPFFEGLIPEYCRE